jgi:hypothetical protein
MVQYLYMVQSLFQMADLHKSGLSLCIHNKYKLLRRTTNSEAEPLMCESLDKHAGVIHSTNYGSIFVKLFLY